MALIALTGASGRIATALRPRLRAAGHRLVLCDGLGVVVRDVDAATERAVECDLRDVDGQADAFAGADLVVHLGAYSDERPGRTSSPSTSTARTPCARRRGARG